jgi:hypothetical protein
MIFNFYFKGQKRQLTVVRMVIKDTIEQELYYRNCGATVNALAMTRSNATNKNVKKASMARTSSITTLLANSSQDNNLNIKDYLSLSQEVEKDENSKEESDEKEQPKKVKKSRAKMEVSDDEEEDSE